MSGFERQKHNKMGESGFYHFYGVVEDRMDPKHRGRVRVRIYGDHTEDLSQLPTNELPWCQMIVPLTSTPNAMPNVWDGQLVFGYYADGVEKQVPIIIGQVQTIENSCVDEEGEKTTGFQDQRVTKQTKRPDETFASTGVDTSPSNPEISSELPQTKILKDTKHTTNIGINNNKFEERARSKGTQYPFNHASETESGHLIEIDDTPGNERLLVQHRSGSYLELLADGTILYKAVADREDITNKNLTTSTTGTSNTLVGNSATTSIGNNYDLAIGSNMSIHVGGNATIKVDGNVQQTIGGSLSINASGTVDIKAGGNINLKGAQVHLN